MSPRDVEQRGAERADQPPADRRPRRGWRSGARRRPEAHLRRQRRSHRRSRDDRRSCPARARLGRCRSSMAVESASPGQRTGRQHGPTAGGRGDAAGLAGGSGGRRTQSAVARVAALARTGAARCRRLPLPHRSPLAILRFCMALQFAGFLVRGVARQPAVRGRHRDPRRARMGARLAAARRNDSPPQRRVRWSPAVRRARQRDAATLTRQALDELRLLSGRSVGSSCVLT